MRILGIREVEGTAYLPQKIIVAMKVSINFLLEIINNLIEIIHHLLGIINNMLRIMNHPLEIISNPHLVRGTDPEFQETTEVAQLEDLAQDLHPHLKEQQQMSKRMGANQQVMRWMIR